MKFVSIVGARPQFIKCALVSKRLRLEAEEFLVHTGQHYDKEMSEDVFRQLGIPKPDINLGIGSGSQAVQTGRMLQEIEGVLLKEKPDRVIVYGDTNSTLAAALAAAKLSIPVAHVEAGLRSFNRNMPEEINRIVTDHLSALLLCPTKTAVRNLKTEGVTRGVKLVGDVMYDSVMEFGELDKGGETLDKFGLRRREYFLVTVHRQENTDDPIRLQGILEALNTLAKTHQILWPVHPRTKKALSGLEGRKAKTKALQMTKPVSYLEMLALEQNARIVLTDSGGIQKEAYWFRIPCVTLRDDTEWVETVEAGWNVLAGGTKAKIIESVENFLKRSPRRKAFSNRRGAVKKVVAALVSKISLWA